MEKQGNYILDTEWLALNFTGYFLGRELELKAALNDKRHRISKVGVSSRVYGHWVEVGLMDDDRPSGKGWVAISLSEIIWLSIIMKLREFGLELNKIKKVKEYFDQHSSKDQQSKFPFLDFYIIYVLTSKEPVTLMVFDSGEAFLARQNAIDTSRHFGSIIEDYISIDLNSLVKDKFKLGDIETDYLNYSLNPIEKEVRQALDFEDVHSLSIKTKGKEYLLNKQFNKTSKAELEPLFRKLEYADYHQLKTPSQVIYKLFEKKKVKK
ncbi:hypothetical protein [Ekhidna sp.]|uniref:hypothetical protein n=1 Tax=Ekhidna sp. TaxID=2608089 RepID=UPI00329A30C0